MAIDFSISQFGGMNSSDQADMLVSRAYQATQNGYVQKIPVESPDLKNMDFDQKGIRPRFGSVEDSNLSSVMVSGESLIRGVEWNNPSTGTRIEIVVGKKSIYTNQSGSWVQLNDSASAAYTHDADVTKVGFASTDGHLFIGLDGANQIQVYKSGADLDDEMKENETYEEVFTATTHTITGTWPTGCYLITVVNSRLIWSDGNTLLEYSPLAHTASQGIWDRTNGGFYQANGNIRMMTSFVPHHTDSVTEVLYVGTDIGIEATTGFATTDKLVRIEGSRSPLNHQAYAKTLNWLCYLTDDFNLMGINGSRIVDLGRRLKKPDRSGLLDSMALDESETSAYGFYNAQKQQAQFWFSTVDVLGADATTTVKMNDTCVVLDMKLGEPVLNEPQTSFEQRVRCLYWVLKDAPDNDWFTGTYLSRNNVIGVLSTGELCKQETGNNDLVLDYDVSGITLSGTDPVSVEVLDHGRVTDDEVKFADVVGTTLLNGNTYPVTLTDADNFTLQDTDSSDYSVYTSGGTIGTGLAIENYWYSPQMPSGETLLRLKQWLRSSIRTVLQGYWLLNVDVLLDRDEGAEKTFTFYQINTGDARFDASYFDNDERFAGGGIVKFFHRIERRSEVLQIKIYNTNSNEPYICANMNFNYQIGAEIT